MRCACNRDGKLSCQPHIEWKISHNPSCASYPLRLSSSSTLASLSLFIRRLFSSISRRLSSLLRCESLNTGFSCPGCCLAALSINRSVVKSSSSNSTLASSSFPTPAVPQKLPTNPRCLAHFSRFIFSSSRSRHCSACQIRSACER